MVVLDAKDILLLAVVFCGLYALVILATMESKAYRRYLTATGQLDRFHAWSVKEQRNKVR